MASCGNRATTDDALTTESSTLDPSRTRVRVGTNESSSPFSPTHFPPELHAVTRLDTAMGILEAQHVSTTKSNDSIEKQTHYLILSTCTVPGTKLVVEDVVVVGVLTGLRFL